MIERNWRFVAVFIACTVVGMIVRSTITEKYKIRESLDNIIRAILWMTPNISALILLNVYHVSFQNLYNYVFPTLGLAFGWDFIKSKGKRSKKEE